MFGEDKKGVVGDGTGDFTYILMLTKIWPGDCKTQLKGTNLRLDEENGKALVMVNGR